MSTEFTKIRVRTKFGTLDFVFNSRLQAIKFAMDESRRREVMSFSVEYFEQYEITHIETAKRRLQHLIDEGNREE